MKTFVNGITINYEIHGNGQWLTLVHGAIDNLNVWYNQIPAFSKHYKVLAYDTRSHGQTELSPEGMSTDLLAEDLFGLLRTLGIQQTFLLGRSMGGAIALRFALSYPKMVKALILSNYAVTGSKEKRPSEAKLNPPKPADDIVSPTLDMIVESRISQVFSPSFIKDHPEVVARYKTIALQNNPDIYLKNPERPSKLSTQIDIKQLSCPVLIIAGSNDTFFSVQEAEDMHHNIPSSQLKELPAGHAAFMEVPKMFNQAVIDFLQNF